MVVVKAGGHGRQEDQAITRSVPYDSLGCVFSHWASVLISFFSLSEIRRDSL